MFFGLRLWAFFWGYAANAGCGGSTRGYTATVWGGGARTRLHFRGGSPATPSEVSARAHFDSLLRYTI